ncbi:DUF397 domain-containing protein [Streptomyces sp. NPDC006997]|uniref:DUF397 domain-containing protein n=1 Tax=Streptomyces sp. NPDC006997 TaxID=3155356 RepID=UPI0033FCAF19
MPSFVWKKSTHSGDASNCVEMATTATALHVRDSKRIDGPVVTVARTAWRPFIKYATRDQPDLPHNGCPTQLRKARVCPLNAGPSRRTAATARTASR